MFNDVDEYAAILFDYAITVCDNAKDQCPYFPTSAQKFHHNFPNPAKATGTPEEVLAEFRSVPDEIKAFSEQFSAEHLN